MALSVLAVDHFGITVGDLDAALTVFVDVLGARELYRRNYAPARGSAEMSRQFGVHPDSSFRLAKVDLAGRHVELFEYAAPDRRDTAPRPCDVGGQHLALSVEDIDAAVAGLCDDPRFAVLGDIQTLPDTHPLAGRRWIYVTTAFGLTFELVCDPI